MLAPINFKTMAESKYNKDYSRKTAEEWLSERKWTGFLSRIPLRTMRGYSVESANDAMSIRTTASMMSNSDDCDRVFKVTIDFAQNMVYVSAEKKRQNDNEL